MNDAKSSKGTIIIGIIVFVMIISFIGSCSGGSDKEYVCSSCGKKFTNSADTRSIAMTSMCEPCYKNFKFKEDLKEELNKYNERYGN